MDSRTGGRWARGRRWREGRLPAVLAIVTALGVTAASCSRDEVREQSTILRVLMTDDWVTPPFLAAVRDFERNHPEVLVDVDRAPISHMLDTVAAAVSTGEAPDVAQAHAFAAAARGLAQPLDRFWAAGDPLEPSEFLPGAMDDVTWGGNLYGVPLDTNALFLLYDSERFSASSVSTGPFTFTSFAAAARALSAPDGSRRAIAIPTNTWWTYGWIRANGGELLHLGPRGETRVTLDDPAATGALEFLAGLVRENLAFPPRAADSHSSDALALFRSGSAATLASGSWDLALLEKDADGDKYRSTPMPSGGPGRAGSVMGGSSMFVPIGSRHQELAFRFMAHLVSDKYALRLAKEEGRLPVRPRVYDDPYFDTPGLKAVIDQLPTASPFKLTAFPQVHDIFAAAVDQVLREGKDARTVMADAQRRAQALMPGRS